MNNQRGLANGVQVALLFPLAFTVLLLTLQWALFSWAQATALAAAQDGARAAAVLEGAADRGSGVAREAAHNGSLSDVRVDLDRNLAETVVTVSGRSLSVVPGWAPTVTKSASVPNERLTQS